MRVRWGMSLTSHEKRREGRNPHGATMKRNRTKLRVTGIVTDWAAMSTLLRREE